MKKLIYSALATGAALAVAFGASANVSAADATPAPVEKSVLKDADYELNGDTLTINSTGTNQILVGDAKVKGTDINPPSAWDVYDNSSNSIKVDLSKKAKTKDVYLAVKADFESDDAQYIVKIPASDAIKAKYEKKDGSIKVTDKLNNEISNWTFRTDSAEGGITDGALLDKTMYQMSGGVVYVSTRQAGTTGEAGADMIVLPKRPAKEAKLSIGKLANAPKVTADYVNGTIAIPKGASYRTYLKTDETIPATQAAIKEAGKFVVKKFNVASVTDYANLKFNGSDEFAVDVQTEAEADKKLASKVGHYVFPALTATEVDTTKVTFGEETEKNGKYTLSLDNKSDIAYNVTWWDSEGADAKSTTKKVAAGKPLKLTNVASKAGIGIQRIGVKGTRTVTASWAGTKVALKDGAKVAAWAEGEAAAPGTGGKTPAVYTVTVNDNKGFYSVESPTGDIHDGDTVVLKNSNERGTSYYDSFTIKDASGNNVEFTEDTTAYTVTFTMPESNVTVTARRD